MLNNFSSCLLTNEESGFVKFNTNISCTDPGYQSFRSWVVIPALVIWSVIIPGIFLFILNKNKKIINNDQTRKEFGCFINPYKPTLYWWGIAIMGFKIAILFAVGLISDPRTTSLLGLLVIYIYYSLTISWSPYQDQQFNMIEKTSVLSYLAIIFLIGFTTNNAFVNIPLVGLTLMVIIIIGNVMFIISRIFQRFKNYKKLKKNEKEGGLKESFLASSQDDKGLMSVAFNHASENEIL